MTVNSKKLHKDILLKIKSVNGKQKALYALCGVSVSTLHRLKTDQGIMMHTFLTLVSWINGNPMDYIILTEHEKENLYKA